MAEEQQRGFKLQRVYIKDVSFESPGAPEIFRTEWKPKVNVQLNNTARRLGETDDYEVEITVTLTAELEDKPAYLVEVKQAGVFTLVGIEGEERDQLLGAYCPNLLFPYAREVVASLVGKGSFPVFHMQPINFDALFAQAQANGQAPVEAEAKH